MGKKRKSSKIKSGQGDVITAPSLPLDEQIEKSHLESQRNFCRIKEQRMLKRNKPDDGYISGDLSTKILKVAREQRLMEEEEEENGEKDDKNEELESCDGISLSKRNRYVSLGGISMASVSDSEKFVDIDYTDDVVNVDPEEEAALEKFLVRKDASAQRTLFDIISEKIDKKKWEVETQLSQTSADDIVVREMDPGVIDMFRQIGALLSTYRSGKIPKAFKIIPKMINWEQILYLTNPDKWSAASMYQATRLFASNLNVKMCERFYCMVLLPRLRDDIDEYKKLNFHLYQALHKAMYKPQAFFKGIIFPLCESGTCTLREAVIFGSVLAKTSIPILHAAAAMMRIAEMEYSGSNSLFLRILIDKKYTLPYRAIDSLLNHFLRFHDEERKLPVLWHQSLLVFVQRYKGEMNKEQRDSLLGLLKVQNHYQITPEIRRELQSCEPARESFNDVDFEQMES